MRTLSIGQVAVGSAHVGLLSVMRHVRSALVILALVAATQGCGGGGNGGGSGSPLPPESPAPPPPGAFFANVQFDAVAQRFVATWNASPDAQQYRVLLKRNETAEFVPLSGAGDLPAMKLDFNFAVGFTIQWSAAALRVEACNTVGCTAAADLLLLPHLAEALAHKQRLSAPEMRDVQIACSADGNTLAIGAPFESGDNGLEPGVGVVYVFTRTGTAWTLGPTLVRAPNGEGGIGTDPGDNFGQAVALSADGATLVVGAPLEDGSVTSIPTPENENNLEQDAGAVYIFVRNGTTYEFKTYLKPRPDSFDTVIAGDQFGGTVALAADGQTLVAGAPSAEAAGRGFFFNEGAAYVFTRATESWTQKALLGGPHTDSNSGDNFGFAVGISADGSTLAVGAPFDDGDAQSTFDNPNSGAVASGAAYIFATTDRVHWLRQAYLKAPNAQVLDKLSIAVALSSDGSTVALGAPGEDGDTTSTLEDENENLRDAGAVYVFTRSGASWSETSPAYLKPSRMSAAAKFGSSLSLAANATTLAVGAPFDVSAPPPEGAAFIFVRTGSSWFEQIRLGGRTVSEAFGRVKLAPDGLTLFVGVEKDRGLPVAVGTVHLY